MITLDPGTGKLREADPRDWQAIEKAGLVIHPGISSRTLAKAQLDFGTVGKPGTLRKAMPSRRPMSSRQFVARVNAVRGEQAELLRKAGIPNHDLMAKNLGTSLPAPKFSTLLAELESIARTEAGLRSWA